MIDILILVTGGGLQAFHFQLDGKFSFLVQSYSDVDAVGDGRYCIFDYYSLLLHYQVKCMYLTESFLLDAARDDLYCVLNYYSLRLNYQMKCLYFTVSPLLSVGDDVGFL